MPAKLALLPVVTPVPAVVPGWVLALFAILAVAVCVAIWVTMASGKRRGVKRRQEDPAASALQILEQRFARGEIRQEEYDERKRAILTMTGPTGNL